MVVKLIIDTDGVSDDIRAICLALSHPDAQVIAFTTVQGCVPVNQATANVIRAQKACGVQKKIPIYQGAEFPLILKEKDSDESFFFGKDGLSDRGDQEPKTEQSDYSSHESEPAASALVRITKEHPDATLVAIGPLTNIALAIKLDPGFKRRPKNIVIMGGNYLGIGNVHSHSSAEYNFHGDPEAAHIVLSETEVPITLVPWEAYYIEGPQHEKVVNFTKHMEYDTPLGRFLMAATEKGRKTAERNGKQYAFCDEIAVSTAIDPERVVKNRREMRGSVELSGRYSRGQLVLDWTGELWDQDREKPVAEAKELDLSRRPLSFVTSYDVHVIDNWLHEACRNSKTTSQL